MSIRIPLLVRRSVDPALRKQGILNEVIRLIVPVRFVTMDGYTAIEQALVDTGAPFSLLPLRIWSRCAVALRGTSTLRGVVPLEECELPVKVGEVQCVLPTESGDVEKLELLAYLSPLDSVPLIVGLDGLWDDFRLVFRRKATAGHIEVNQNAGHS